MSDEPVTQEISDDADQPATKGDLEMLRRELTATFATKEELQRQLAATEQRILHHFDAAVENIIAELKGANADEISALRDTDIRLHDRLIPLEQQAGIGSPESPHS